MNDKDNPATGTEQPGATGGDKPAATNPQGSAPATNDNLSVPEGYELIRTEDKNKLIAGRDKANNDNRESSEFVAQLAKERAVDTFLDENKEKYPDVKREDLMFAETEEEAHAMAERMQARLKGHVQEALKNVQTASAPVLTPEEIKAQEAKLKKDKPANAFERMVDLRSTPVSQ